MKSLPYGGPSAELVETGASRALPATDLHQFATAGDERPPLFIVKGDASDEEVAALAAVLQALASAGTSASHERPRPRSEWSAPRRSLRGALAHGPGGWRASSLPR